MDAFLGAVFSGAQIWTLTVTATDRYTAVKSITYHARLRHVLLKILLVWSIP